jgi:hypothetical protein
MRHRDAAQIGFDRAASIDVHRDVKEGKTMRQSVASVVALTIACVAASVTIGAQSTAAPAGFTALFNGKDLSGWRGRPGGGGVFSPYVEAKFTPEERAAKQKEWNDDRDLHWRVDAAKGEIVSDGKGVHLATEKAYGDFELRVDWLLTQAGGDSGIYLRSYPQVQLWDPANPRDLKNGADKGSGGLWNNNPDNPGRWPLVKADNPIGEWNALVIKMVGTRVWVTLNGKSVVVGQVLDNFFDRAQPVLPTGSIELQTHGSEVRFRNIYVREIPDAEGKALLATVAAAK